MDKERNLSVFDFTYYSWVNSGPQTEKKFSSNNHILCKENQKMIYIFLSFKKKWNRSNYEIEML